VCCRSLSDAVSAEMSTIQQLKNFIRHGKQARVANFNEEPQRKNEDSPPRAAQPLQQPNMPASEPALGDAPHGHQPLDAYSEAPANGQNKVAQAGNAAAHHHEAAQNVQDKNSKSKRVDDANLAKLIAEENASKSKFPRYPGLERYQLLEKMGDGAFSNVYRARDLQGDQGEVGIKVVRKYEMNRMQGNKHLHPDFKKVPKAAEVREKFSYQTSPDLTIAVPAIPKCLLSCVVLLSCVLFRTAFMFLAMGMALFAQQRPRH
jgi:hypothetical protein